MGKLVDKFGRQITYLRLAVTDRCNLRCLYCMPEKGADIVPRKELLSYKEMYRITRTLSELGVNKVRLTGGEPFVRRDFINFLEMLSFNDNLEAINITTNGALISQHISKLEELKINSVNLSLDSLRSEKFAKITRRNIYDDVFEAFERLEASAINLKLNVVVQSGVNTDEIADFVALTKKKDIAVRFIEEMPFNGKGIRAINEVWDYHKIASEIGKHFRDVEQLPLKRSSTSRNFKVKNHKGTVGIIPAYTRTICNDCNRIRVTSTGLLKNCLFDDGVFNLRDFIRNGASNDDLKELFVSMVAQKPQNGFIAEANRKNNKRVSESMATIGG